MQEHWKWFTGRFCGAPFMAAALALMVGCQSKAKQGPTDIHVPPESVTNAQTLDTSFTQQIRNGAATGHTIYPHHFVLGDVALTLVGQKHFNALLPRSDIDQVQISVPKGAASDALYRARLDALRERFVEAGYDEERFTLADTLAGGDGISSDRVLLLTAKEEQSAGGQGYRRAGGSGSSDRSFGSGQGRSSGGGGGSGGGSGGGGSR